MKIVTCIKQVPASSNVQVDPVTGVLIRDSNNAKLNPYDLYALEAAFLIKEKVSKASLTAITMGPPNAKSVLKEALYMGADEAVLVTDRRFAGADVLATSYTLSQLIKLIGDADIIVCGKQTTDGDTAQVGPEIAEFLNVPHIPYVSEIIEILDDKIVVKSTYDSHDEINEIKFPCLLTVEKSNLSPRLPSYKRKMKLRDYQIKTVTLDDLNDKKPEHYGLNGSPTQVEEIFPPSNERKSKFIEGDKETLAQEMFKILDENKFL
ncbi:MAG: electron transfer flavoprotein subunit beta/FixA family protein [Candidatus Izemoplasmatales bacterium]